MQYTHLLKICITLYDLINPKTAQTLLQNTYQLMEFSLIRNVCMYKKKCKYITPETMATLFAEVFMAWEEQQIFTPH